METNNQDSGLQESQAQEPSNLPPIVPAPQQAVSPGNKTRNFFRKPFIFVIGGILLLVLIFLAWKVSYKSPIPAKFVLKAITGFSNSF